MKGIGLIYLERREINLSPALPLPVMVEDTECIHGLEKSWCSICLHGISPHRDPLTMIAGPFKAQYDGYCVQCDLPIITGQPIGMMSDDTYIHFKCKP